MLISIAKKCHWVVIVALVLSFRFLRADDPPLKLKTEVLLEGLDNPCGVAVRPVKVRPYEIFVSESGAGKIVRVMSETPKVSKEIVTGFSLDTYGKGSTYNIGPLGLAFLDRYMLVVGDGGSKDGAEVVRLYQLDDQRKEPFKVEDEKQKVGPIKGETEPSPGEGNFFGVATNDNAVFVTSNGDDSAGWLLKATHSNRKLVTLRTFIKTKEFTEVNAPTAITVSPRGELVVAQMGSLDKPNDSVIAFYHPQTGKMLLKIETGLHDITGLAYSPTDKFLYALDFAWSRPEEGGLFRLDAVVENGKQVVKPLKLLSLDRPTACAFDAESSLYVTTIGGAKKEAANDTSKSSESGQLLKITSETPKKSEEKKE